MIVLTQSAEGQPDMREESGGGVSRLVVTVDSDELEFHKSLLGKSTKHHISFSTTEYANLSFRVQPILANRVPLGFGVAVTFNSKQCIDVVQSEKDYFAQGKVAIISGYSSQFNGSKATIDGPVDTLAGAVPVLVGHHKLTIPLTKLSNPVEMAVFDVDVRQDDGTIASQPVAARRASFARIGVHHIRFIQLLVKFQILSKDKRITDIDTLVYHP